MKLPTREEARELRRVDRAARDANLHRQKLSDLAKFRAWKALDDAARVADWEDFNLRGPL